MNLHPGFLRFDLGDR